jgi:hypothetical protein
VAKDASDGFVPSMKLIGALATLKDRRKIQLVALMLEVLFVNGADPNFTTVDNMTPLGLMLTIKLPEYDPEAFFQVFQHPEHYYPVLDCLLQHGADSTKRFTHKGFERSPIGHCAERMRSFFEFITQWEETNTPVSMVTPVGELGQRLAPRPPRQPVAPAAPDTVSTEESVLSGCLSSC